MTEDEAQKHQAWLVAATRAASEVAEMSTVALFAERRDQVGLAGSGTLLSVADEHFVVTAAHVAELADADAEDPVALYAVVDGVVVPLAESSIYLSSRPFKPVKPNAAGLDHTADPRQDREADIVDVALIHLREQAQRSLRLNHRFLRHTDIASYDAGPPFLVYGFPAGRSVVRLADVPTIVALPFQICSLAYDGPQPKRTDPLRGFLLDYRHVGPPAGVNERGEPTHGDDPRGMSGCGVWSLPPADWTGPPSDAVRLVGIEHAYDQDAGFLRCTRIQVAMATMIDNVPGTDRALYLWRAEGSGVLHVIADGVGELLKARAAKRGR